MVANIDNSKLLLDWFSNDDYKRSLVVDEKKLSQDATLKTLKLFHSAARDIPAYKDFLKKNDINAAKVTSITDYSNIPLTTKENYIDKYSVDERCWNGDIRTMHMISTSSGTTGLPHFWPRNLEGEIDGASIHEYIFTTVFDLANKKTLLLNGFAMGNWIAGTFTLACCNLVAWKGYPLTIMTPGYSLEAMLEVMERLDSSFDQVIITGHTPFLKELVEQAKAKGITLKHKAIKLLGTGQAVTENWRSYMLNLLGTDQYYNTFLNLYGSADASLMGFETPLSIHVRRTIAMDTKMVKKIFASERLPSIYNYDPRLTFFESINNELVITKNNGCPLIRYNIHDEGGVLSNNEILSHIDLPKGHNFGKSKLPFVYLFGREKFMAKIYGANIYTEHVQMAIDHEKLQAHLTGRFIIETDLDESLNPRLICRVELNANIVGDDRLVDLVKEIFVEEVRKINSEYNFVLNSIGENAKPHIILHEYGHPIYFPKGKMKKNA